MLLSGGALFTYKDFEFLLCHSNATHALLIKMIQPSVHDGTDLFHFCDVNDDGDKA